MSNRNFYCHSCSDHTEVNIEQWKCNRCSLGFIEELLPQRRREEAGSIRIYNSPLEEGGVNSGQRPELYISQNGDLTTTRPQQGQSLQSILNSLFGGLNMNNFNPNDYAWGDGGLDNIITQLMQQVEGGAPPAAAELVEQLESQPFSEELRKSSTQCSICMTDYNIGDEIIQLSCDHFFHTDCIKNWLSHHNTCPVCRMPLS